MTERLVSVLLQTVLLLLLEGMGILDRIKGVLLWGTLSSNGVEMLR